MPLNFPPSLFFYPPPWIFQSTPVVPPIIATWYQSIYLSIYRKICPYLQNYYSKTKIQHIILLLFLLFSQIKMVWMDSIPSPITDEGKQHSIKSQVNQGFFSFIIFRNSLMLKHSRLSKTFLQIWFYTNTMPRWSSSRFG